MSNGVDIFERAMARASAERDQITKALLESVIARLKESALDDQVLGDLVRCQQQEPVVIGYLWWKKYKCPHCNALVKINNYTTSSIFFTHYTVSSCKCGWLWAKRETW